MRVTRRVARDEGGAVVLIALLSLVALLGMVVLVVDVGGMLGMRRRLVRAADAAALAAAQSCAWGSAADAAAAPAQADAYAIANLADAVASAYEASGCGVESSGEVTVTYEAEQQLFFAPVIGAGSSEPVSATATAIWGPASAGIPIPLELPAAGGVLPCAALEVGDTCAHWWNNAVGAPSGGGTWGFVNLDTWGAQPGDPCPAPGTAELSDWILGDGPEVRLSAEGPTYVCVAGGHRTTSWFDALVARIGDTVVLPVTDPSGTVTTSGREKYLVIGFTSLVVERVLRGDDPEAIGVAAASGTCERTMSLHTGETVLLTDLTCVPDGASVAPPVLTRRVAGVPVVFVEGVDYAYDAATATVRWLAEPATSVRVATVWATAGLEGACGIEEPDPNAICLVTSWQGTTIGGEGPGTGPDFGLRAFRLSA